MRKNDCGRIVVGSNDKMQKIIQWYQDNSSWLDKEEFHAPLESGLVILKEENIEFTFESKGNVVEISVYPMRGNIAAITYDYDPVKKDFSNYRFPAYFKDLVEIDESRAERRSKHEAKKIRKPGQPLPLIRKTYVVKEIDVNKLKISGEKRNYTKPDKEVRVRGFFRTSKTGKISWVKPFSKYKNKDKKGNNEYQV